MSVILHTYDEILAAGWEKLVEQSPYATWFQTPEAYRFYSALPDEMMPFAVGVQEDGMLTGVIVGYTTLEKNAIKQMFTRRSIIIGGPLLSPIISENALSELLFHIRKESHNAIYIETRNLHDYSTFRSVFETCGWKYQPHLNLHIVTTSADAMWQGISKSRRRQVRKAKERGINITEATREKDVVDFYKLLKHLYDAHIRLPLFSENFFLTFYRKQYGKILLATYNNKVVGGMMCPILQHSDTANSPSCLYEWFVVGDNQQYAKQFPSVAITFGAMRYANTHHLQRFDFMGAGSPSCPYSVRDFKAKFGGEQVEFGRYLFIQHPLFYRIGCIGVHKLRSII